MAKRGKLEILKDMLTVIREHHNEIKVTPLIRKSNLSTSRFKEYYSELQEKEFVEEKVMNGNKLVSMTEKGFRFLEKYRAIVSFIDEFDL